MPSPASPQAAPPVAEFHPGSSGRSPVSASPVFPRRPALGCLETFSVEAILARPEPPWAAFPPQLSTHAAWSFFCTVPPEVPHPVLPWVCPTTWLPVHLGVRVYPLWPPPCVPRPSVAHLCGPQGFGHTGLEVLHCSGFWSPRDWAPAMDLQDTERHQKRVRTMFTLQQLEELEKVFAKQHNLVGKKRAQLAARLHLTENQVRIWFQNRRVKYQKQQKLKLPASSAMSAPLEEPSSSSNGSIQDEDVGS
uniref:Notochord homeobox n=1 Tax=Nannospalax galili TaxID=1026970 RepID=A0A8C6W394_NANGA